MLERAEQDPTGRGTDGVPAWILADLPEERESDENRRDEEPTWQADTAQAEMDREPNERDRSTRAWLVRFGRWLGRNGKER